MIRSFDRCDTSQGGEISIAVVVGETVLFGYFLPVACTVHKFCMFHKRGWLPLPPVEHTKPRGCTSVVGGKHWKKADI